MQADGVTTIVLFNKGAQFSYASCGENMEDVLKYLKDHPEYDVKVLGYRQYSDDDRFRTVMAKAIKADADALFPGVAPQDLCIMIGSHGLPQWMIDKKDPAIKQMEGAFASVSQKLAGYKTYHGYLNDDFIPGAKWVGPKASDLAPTLVKDKCKNVLLDGRLSFTTHHRATYYDMDYEVRNILETPAKLANGKLDPTWTKPKVVLAPNFDGDPLFAELIVDLTKDALAGKGPVVKLKETGKKALAPNSVGKVGVDPFFTN
jgi:protoheme ferro-lyase